MRESRESGVKRAKPSLQQKNPSIFGHDLVVDSRGNAYCLW